MATKERPHVSLASSLFTSVVAAILGCAGTMAVYGLAEEQASDPDPSTFANDDDLDDVRSRLHRLERGASVRQIVREIRSEPTAEASKPTAVNASQPSSRPVIRLTPEETREYIGELQSFYGETLASRPEDRQRAQEVHADFEAALDKPTLRGVSLLESDCRKDLCRARFYIDIARDTDAFEIAQAALTSDGPINGDSVRLALGEGEFEFYFSPPGTPLPSIAAHRRARQGG